MMLGCVGWLAGWLAGWFTRLNTQPPLEKETPLRRLSCLRPRKNSEAKLSAALCKARQADSSSPDVPLPRQLLQLRQPPSFSWPRPAWSAAERPGGWISPLTDVFFPHNQRGVGGGRQYGRPAFLPLAKGLSVKAWPYARKALPAIAFTVQRGWVFL